MAITINEELRAYIDPLTEDEYAALERSLLSEGCRDALVLWGDLLVDGHNRYSICQKHGISFNTVQNKTFQSLDDVHLWMIDNHLGRRSVSDFQRGVLALRKREIVSARLAQEKAQQPSVAADEAEVTAQSTPQPVLTRQASVQPAGGLCVVVPLLQTNNKRSECRFPGCRWIARIGGEMGVSEFLCKRVFV